MKLKMFTLFCLLSYTFSLIAEVLPNDDVMWESAYNGDFSLVHKLVLDRECLDINDDMLSQFAMAYLYYRLGQKEDVELIFKGIDSYLQHVFKLPEKN